MANIKISQLAEFTGSTDNTWLILNNSAQTETFKITRENFLSGITTYTEITYSELYTLFTGETLTPGQFYLMTDFQTCYDQPDFDQNGNAIIGNNYKTGTTEPIVVLATGINSFSPKAYSLEYPKDDISYDITFTQTERTGNPAKGRITERIDEKGNRTDYDFRAVLFKRYDFYYSENYYTGSLSIDGSNGLVTGIDTSFSDNFNVGDILGVYEGPFSNPSGCFKYYEILTISGATEMTVTGKTIQSYINTAYSRGISFGNYRSFHQTNIASNTAYTEYLTFDTPNVFNVKIGNYANLYNWQENPFLLSNNVFLTGSYEDIIIGNESYDNTFDDDMNALSIGNNCYRNIITNDFDRNTIGNYFRSNIIICDMADNQIGNYFQYNMLGDNDGPDFDQNRIGNYFESNFITFANDDFFNNEIGDSFYYNLIDYGFQNNVIVGQFYDNRMERSFNNNTIGINFYNNKFKSSFNQNQIKGEFYSNEIYSDFYGNNIGVFFNGNDIGDSQNLNNFEFYDNEIGNYYQSNTIRQNFYENKIGVNFQNNVVNGNFYRNVIGHNFNQNSNIGYDFYNNNIGYGFNGNYLIGDYFQGNRIGDYFSSNIISYSFDNNQIGNYYESNTFGNVQYFNWNNTDIENLSLRTYNLFSNTFDGENIGNVILGKELIMHDTENGAYYKVKFTQWTQGGNGGGFSYERTKVYPDIEPTVYFTKKNYGNEVDIIVEGSLEITRGNNGAIYNSAQEEGWNSNQSPLNTEWNSIYTQLDNGRNYQNNQIGNNFNQNTISNNFRNNQIGHQFYSNTILEGFGFGGSQYQGNKIGNYFYNNSVGEYFYNNVIPDNFTNNFVNDYFQWNNVNTEVNGLSLLSCLFYSATTVNLIKNNNSNLRLSYFDENDILTVESINEVPCISFTISSSDFTSGNAIYSNTTPLGPNGVNGFENTAPDVNDLGEGYYAQGLQGTTLSQIITAYNSLGLATNNTTGYVWNVTWGDGSTINSGLVKFGFREDLNLFDIQTIDPTDTNWTSPGNGNGTSLVGTFLFPATFTPYLPLISKGGWC